MQKKSYPMDSDANPIQHFQKWFCEVRDHFPEVEVNAMALSTQGTDGFPKTRMVLLKQYTWEGFIFYTQYTSEKGKAMAAYPKVSLLFPWQKANRRVTILGNAAKILKAQSEAYFDLRPEGSKIGAWASRQSEPIASREVLEQQYDHYASQFEGQTIPKPERWGGYLVQPAQFIFERIDRDTSMIEKTTYDLMDIDWVVKNEMVV